MALNDVECCDFYQVHEDVVRTVRDKMPDEDVLYDLAEVFKVFGDSTRIKILYVLSESEMCVCDIAQLLNMNQSAISPARSTSSLEAVTLLPVLPVRTSVSPSSVYPTVRMIRSDTPSFIFLLDSIISSIPKRRKILAPRSSYSPSPSFSFFTT